MRGRTPRSRPRKKNGICLERRRRGQLRSETWSAENHLVRTAWLGADADSVGLEEVLRSGAGLEADPVCSRRLRNSWLSGVDETVLLKRRAACLKFRVKPVRNANAEREAAPRERTAFCVGKRKRAAEEAARSERRHARFCYDGLKKLPWKNASARSLCWLRDYVLSNRKAAEAEPSARSRRFGVKRRRFRARVRIRSVKL